MGFLWVGYFISIFNMLAAGAMVIAADLDSSDLSERYASEGAQKRAPVEPIQERQVRDFPVRSIGTLSIVNPRGEVSVKGWAHDKVRVTLIKTLFPPNNRPSSYPSSHEEGGNKKTRDLLSSATFDYQDNEGDIEIVARYGSHFGIRERLEERAQGRLKIHFLVEAPSQIPLSIWSGSGDINVESWRAGVAIRADGGEIHVRELRAAQLDSVCLNCRYNVQDVRGKSLRIIGGSRLVELNDVKAEEIYVEARFGSIHVIKVDGDQTYLTQGGNIHARATRGQVWFQSDSGAIELVEGSGFSSGQTKSGSIDVRMESWRFSDQAVFESLSGDISISLPNQFSGHLELSSRTGEVNSRFAFKKKWTFMESSSLSRLFMGVSSLFRKPQKTAVFPVGNSVKGQVADGGEWLRVMTLSGSIRVAPLSVN